MMNVIILQSPWLNITHSLQFANLLACNNKNKVILKFVQTNHHFDFACIIIDEMTCFCSKIMLRIGHVFNNNPLIIIPMSVVSVGEIVFNNRNIINNLSRQNQTTHHSLPPVVCTILIKNGVVQNTTSIEHL
jgi:hypothetical protein